eukprot:4472789-Amphidinium_carterae.1
MYKIHGFDQGALTHHEADEAIREMENTFFWIIDDASHRVDFTSSTFRYFHHHLDSEGVYIYEDAHSFDEHILRKGVGGRFDMWNCKYDGDFYVMTHLSAYPQVSAALVRNESFRLVPVDKGENTSRALPVAGKFLGVAWNETAQLERWLISKEIQFGALVTNLPCHGSQVKVPAQSFEGPVNCSGGMRMKRAKPWNRRGGACFAKLVEVFASSWEESSLSGKLDAMEIGVARGTGVAVWAELFPGARVHALDRYYSNIERYTPNLIAKGAFQH